MAVRGKRFPWEDKLLRSGYLLGAVLLHLIIFALLAGYVVFRSPPREEPVVLTPPYNPNPPDPRPVNPPDNTAAGSASAVSIDTSQSAQPAPMPKVVAGHDDFHVSVPAGTLG